MAELRRRGRPRAFDRDAALERAMQAFWARGYDATQVSDLLAAMNINPPSFYAAFVSKAATYREAVGRYLQTAGAGAMKALEEGADAKAAIWGMLRASAMVALESPSRGGCMVSLGLVNSCPGNADIRIEMRELRRETTKRIGERLRQGIADSEIRDDADVDQLAMFFAASMQAISLQAQDDASEEQLLGLVNTSVSVLGTVLVDKGKVKRTPESGI